MNLVVGLVVVVVATAVTVTVMLAVRRRAPAGSWFQDGDRASGVFGVLATGFSVLLGFIIFLSFQSYDSSRTGAELEATTVLQQTQTAQFLPSGVSAELTAELACYARSVAGVEWEALESGTLGDRVNPWGVELFRTISDVVPREATEQSAYDRWMDQTIQREQARITRVHGAEGIIPLPLWLALFLITLVIFGYLLFFADASEGAVTQGMLMGSTTAVITMLLLLLAFFDHPHGDGIGRLQPAAMERTVRVIDTELAILDLDLELPCDSDGNPR